MDNEQLNRGLVELVEREELIPDALTTSGKAIAFYGWFWRAVDFDRPITFAYANGEGFDVPGWVGFCENNKWGYEQFEATEEQSRNVRSLCEALVVDPSKVRATILFDYMQSTRPATVIGAKRWTDSRVEVG
jgi:hypothetical protein